MARDGMIAMLTLEEAWEKLFGLVRPLESEVVAVDGANGRYLASPLIARRTQPSRDLSAMDGFAISGTGPWTLIGESRAGFDYDGTLADGTAVRISTGAACPQGADGIVIREDARFDGGKLRSEIDPNAGFIRRRGFDFAEGERLLDTGSSLGAAQIALARAAGHASLEVFRKPRVTLVELGDELVDNPVDCPVDRLPASNGAMVGTLIGALAETSLVGPLPDQVEALVEVLRRSADANVIVTTAGASVGEHDPVKAALALWGADIDFWRVAIKPGKPLLVATRESQIVLGLPGNPASAFVTAFLFLIPLLRALQGAAARRPRSVAMRLGGPLAEGGDRREFLRGTVADGRAWPLPERDSSALRTLAAAEILIEREPFAAPASIGDVVPTYWIGNG